MSTASPSADAPVSDYADCDEYIEYQIEIARNRIKWTELFTALLLAGVLLIGYVLIFTVFDHWIVSGGFRPWPRAIMLGVVVCICLGIVWRFVIQPWTRRIHPLYAARMLDQEDPEFEGTLMSAVDLNASGAQAPEPIKKAIEKRAARRLSGVNLDQAIDRRRLMQLGLTLFLLVVATCLYAVLSPKEINLLRPLSVAESSVATRTRILKVSPGDATIDAGQQLEIVADIGGQVPEEVFVTYSTVDRTYVDQQLRMQATEDNGRFRVLMVGESDRGLRQDLTYTVSAGDAVSETFRVTVTQPPRARVTQQTYTYPEYTTLTPRTVENGNIDVWEGTSVSLRAESNVPLKSALLKFSDDAAFSVPAEEVALTVNGNEITGEFPMTIREDGTFAKFYRIDVIDEDDRTDPAPTVYAVNVRPDRPPVVRLLDPIRDLRVPSNAIVPMLVSAEDPDFLLRSVRLSYEVNGEPRTPELLFDSTRTGMQKSWTGTREFSLEPLEVRPGDIVRYHVTARDNRPPLGSQSRTGTLQLIIEAPATKEEVQEQLRQDREHQQQQLREQRTTDETQPEPDQEQKTGDEQKTAGEDSATDANDDGDGTEQNEGTQEGSKKDSGGDGEGSKSNSGTAGDAESSNSGEGTKSDGSEGADGGNSDGASSGEAGEGSERRKPASEDEALQKLIDSYRDSKGNNDNEDASESSDDKSGQNGNASDEENSGDSQNSNTNTTGDNDTGSDAKTTAEPRDGADDGSDPASDVSQSGDDPKDGTETSADGNEVGSNEDDKNPAPNEGDDAGSVNQNSDDPGTESTGGKTNDDRGDGTTSESTDAQDGSDVSNSSQDMKGNEPPENQSQDGKGEDGKGQDGKEEDGKGQDGKGQDGKGQDGKGQDGKGQDGKGKGKGGQGQSGEGKGGKSQGKDGKGGKGPNGGGKSADGSGGGGGQGGQTQQGDGKAGGQKSDGSGAGGDGAGTQDQSDVEDAAEAADLALKRLKQDLERGKVDKKLLEELGWTEDQLKSFSEQMHDKLNTLKDDSAEDNASRLQRRRVEELLKSLDLESTPQERVGKSTRDREQQDTTSRQSRPPAQYREWLRRFQESVSRGRGAK